ncbi:plasmid pRiA4b ORF-3 family protein [Schleiferilactobacillus shenzhenensis]|uniref:plasmid pRiA4b ORF-3 family protein n=1 Tax=Schleiferilactobacillus shenzhenensis TaxID=1231337 RepID=UPI00040A3F09|nr:plasmid pRiA4b ORF-3 family protein [Schleiferilactobacillus shenzhenensis]
MAEKESLQLKITLRGFHPPVWRRVVVPDTVTLADLHTIIQIAFDWSDEHLHDFYSTQNAEVHYGPAGDETVQGDEAKTLARPLLEDSNVMYTYDFGDEWKHLIHLEKVLPASGFHRAPVPYCVTGRGASPAEDSGGGDDAEDRTPLDVAAINRQLSAHFATSQTKAAVKSSDPAKSKAEVTPAPPEDVSGSQIAQSFVTYLRDHADVGDAVVSGRKVSPAQVKDLADYLLQQTGAASADSLGAAAINDTTLAKDLETIKRGDIDNLTDAYFQISDADLTSDQIVHVVQTVMDGQWLFAHITATDDQHVGTRTTAAALLTDMLIADQRNVPKLALPAKMRTAVFQAATRYARAEKGLQLMPWSDGSPLSAALSLLNASVTHVSYPKKMLTDLQDTLIAIFTNLQAPFISSEPEIVLGMLLTVGESGELTQARYKRILKRITKAVFAGDPSAMQTMRARSWVQVLFPLTFGLYNDSDYDDDLSADILMDVLDFYDDEGVTLDSDDDDEGFFDRPV